MLILPTFRRNISIFPDTAEHCWRCGTERGTILYIFWMCPKWTTFWTADRTICQKYWLWDPRRPSSFPTTRIHHVHQNLQKNSFASPTERSTSLHSLAMETANSNDHSTMAEEGGRHELDGRLDAGCEWQARDKGSAYKKTWTLWNMFIYSEEGKSLFGTSTPSQD